MTNNARDCHPNDAENNVQVLDGLRVLVVDDNADNRILIRFILESFNFEVMTVSSVMEAVEVIGKLQPNLLISDIVLPGINGYTLIRKIRSIDSPLGKIPAIALTGVDGSEERNLARKYGFQAYLIKPISPDELILEISKIVKIQPNNQLPNQNDSEITSTSENLFASKSKQVNKLPIQTKFLNKDFANHIIAWSKKLKTNSKQLQMRSREAIANSKQLKIRYNDLGCRFVALKAHFGQTQQKLGLIKLYQKV